MINALSIEDINSVAPYKVQPVGDNRVIYTFVTDSGVELAIDFMDDDLIPSAESYQLVISNVNNKRSPRDSKVQKTILAIVTEFFEKNQAGSTKKGKKSARPSYRPFSLVVKDFFTTELTCSSSSSFKNDLMCWPTFCLLVSNS